MSFENGTKLDEISSISRFYEVQDYASQQVLSLYQAKDKERWWDACAGSGGKSIPLMLDYPGIDLLVTDRRRSILKNLDGRFQKAGIKNYSSRELDFQDEDVLLPVEPFDGIIVDAPCSGSGTWGRSPERLGNFDLAQLQSFTALQKKIVSKVAPLVKEGKPLLYITCSVYQAENEEVVDYLVKNFGFKAVQMEYFQGHAYGGDTLFAARLIRALPL